MVRQEALLALPSSACVDDSQSRSSTFDINNHHQRPKLHLQRKPSIKRVHFDLSRNIENENKAFTKRELLQCNVWYTKNEQDKMKEDMKAVVKKYRKADDFEEHNKKRAGADPYQQVMERLYRSCCQKTPDCRVDSKDEYQLRLWAAVAPDRVGLERWIFRKLGKDCRIRRNELIETITELQSEMPSTLDVDRIQERIRLACESISGPSTRMAQVLGHTRAACFNDA